MLSLVLSVVALSLLIALSLVAIFHPKYHENWLQFAGLWGIVFGGTAKVAQLLDRDYSSAENTLLFGALAMFALGTALKWRRFNAQRRVPSQQRP
jgi:FtsH-binding integral membrane protein